MKTITIERKPTAFFLPADELRAAYQCASKEEARYYIMGAFVTQTEAGIKIVATDGRVMAAVGVPEHAFIGDDCFTQEDGFILKADVSDKAFKAKSRGPLWVYGDIETGILQFLDFYAQDDSEHNRVGVCEFSRIDGTYPDWTRVQPKGEGGAEYVAFDPKVLTKLTKAAEVLSRNTMLRMVSGDTPEDPMLVQFSNVPQLTGTLMPIRWRG